MYSIHHTILSRKDTKDIWKYIAKDNANAANQLVRSIAKRIEVLAESPNIGNPRDDLHPGIQQLVIGNYIIFYHVNEEQESVSIKRILHSARNLSKLDYS